MSTFYTEFHNTTDNNCYLFVKTAFKACAHKFPHQRIEINVENAVFIGVQHSRVFEISKHRVGGTCGVIQQFINCHQCGTMCFIKM